MTVMGLDEVGRGSWAGPLVACAVVLSKPIPGLSDSKLLSRRQRENLYDLINAKADAIGLGWVTPAEVDALGLTNAVKLAMKKAYVAANHKHEDLVVDGNINFLADVVGSRHLIKADRVVSAVSAASIVAKVTRDRYMTEQEAYYPGYGFSSHVGYGTKEHKDAIIRLGICKLHRRSYKPIKLLGGLEKSE